MWSEEFSQLNTNPITSYSTATFYVWAGDYVDFAIDPYGGDTNDSTTFTAIGNFEPGTIPEPGTLALLGVVGGIGAAIRRRRLAVGG